MCALLAKQNVLLSINTHTHTPIWLVHLQLCDSLKTRYVQFVRRNSKIYQNDQGWINWIMYAKCKGHIQQWTGGRFSFVIWKIHVHRFRVRETRFAEPKKIDLFLFVKQSLVKWSDFFHALSATCHTMFRIFSYHLLSTHFATLVAGEKTHAHTNHTKCTVIFNLNEGFELLLKRFNCIVHWCK